MVRLYKKLFEYEVTMEVYCNGNFVYFTFKKMGKSESCSIPIDNLGFYPEETENILIRYLKSLLVYTYANKTRLLIERKGGIYYA